MVTGQAPKFSGKNLSRFSYIVDPGVGVTQEEEDLVSQGTREEDPTMQAFSF